MYSISKDFAFSASHQLEGLPIDHPCSRLHGHNYRVKITLSASKLNEVGFIVDYRDLDKFKIWIDAYVDHYHLNKVFPEINPTAENLARKFHEQVVKMLPLIVDGLGAAGIPWLVVAVSETDKTWASYELDNMDYGDPGEYT